MKVINCLEIGETKTLFVNSSVRYIIQYFVNCLFYREEDIEIDMVGDNILDVSQGPNPDFWIYDDK